MSNLTVTLTPHGYAAFAAAKNLQTACEGLPLKVRFNVEIPIYNPSNAPWHVGQNRELIFDGAQLIIVPREIMGVNKKNATHDLSRPGVHELFLEDHSLTKIVVSPPNSTNWLYGPPDSKARHIFPALDRAIVTHELIITAADTPEGRTVTVDLRVPGRLTEHFTSWVDEPPREDDCGAINLRQ